MMYGFGMRAGYSAAAALQISFNHLICHINAHPRRHPHEGNTPERLTFVDLLVQLLLLPRLPLLSPLLSCNEWRRVRRTSVYAVVCILYFGAVATFVVVQFVSGEFITSICSSFSKRQLSPSLRRLPARRKPYQYCCFFFVENMA